MPWSQSDLDAVRAAVLALATGTRTVSISFTGPPARSESFAIVQLGELRALLAEITRELGGAGGYRLAATRKGLGQ
jgi:hypothetical protein